MKRCNDSSPSYPNRCNPSEVKRFYSQSTEDVLWKYVNVHRNPIFPKIDQTYPLLFTGPCGWLSKLEC